MKIYLTLVLILLFSISSRSAEENPSLKFMILGVVVKEYKLSELKDKLNSHEINFLDHQYGKEKSYRGFLLQDILQLGFGDEWKSSDYTDVAFAALDGYTAVATILQLQEIGGYIVYEDLEHKDWEPISIRQVTPGPFYLVWTGKDQITANEYPRPWQLVSIDLIKFNSQYPKVIPKGAVKDSSAYKGFEIFEGRCIRCHAMNQQGGTVGPDLNAPQSIVSYRSENMIKEFIKNPSKYRYTHMPDHLDLSDQDLDNLISYFNYMNENRD
ncbi:MAG: cytochrome c [Thermodesulfobacteriota bacterium]